jgi:mannose-1-phosphate guanylyltransferase
MAELNAQIVIMAGGRGTRFWPKSTKQTPKQLLSFGEDQTLLEETVKRFQPGVPAKNFQIVTTELLLDQVNEVFGADSEIEVLAEPTGRNTAPCVYWAARVLADKDPKAVMAVMPADHFIADQKAFLATFEQAVSWARDHDDLVTLGVTPTRPETGYGYLEMGDSLGGDTVQVKRFVEKPNRDRAIEFWKSKRFLWNGGMFVWRAETILKAFDEFLPQYRETWDACGGDVAQAYPKMEATSIDFGVMERASNVVTFPLNCGWDDLGSWISLENLASNLKAEQPEGTVTGGDVVGIDSTGNIVDAEGHVVALIDIHDTIVVQKGKSLLVAKKARGQEVKKIVERLEKERPELI